MALPLLSLPTTSVSSTLKMHSSTSSKRVQFQGKISVREISRLGETDTEKSQFWYTQQQYDTIRIRDRRIIGMMNDNNVVINEQEEESTYTTRGLEYRTREVTCHRRNVRESARSAVLEEQAFQREHNFHDPNTISLIYYELTKRSQRDARIMGLNDERYVTTRENLVVVSSSAASADVVVGVVPPPLTVVPHNSSSSSNNMEVIAATAARVAEEGQTPQAQTATSTFFGKAIAQQNNEHGVAMPDTSDHRRRFRRSAGAAAA